MLYKQIDEHYQNDAGIEVLSPELSYDDQGKKVTIQFEDNQSDLIEINKYDDFWDASQHNLHYHQVVKIEKPANLFGEDRVTGVTNAIGLAAHVYSKTAKFQKTLASVQTLRMSDKPFQFILEEDFPIGSLRGEVEFELFFYLKEQQETNVFQAAVIGTRLSNDIFNTKLVIDGEGANFPIVEEPMVDGPLWTIRKFWTDPSIDSFDSTSVQIVLNTKHKAFKSITTGKTAISATFMQDIIVQSMAMIIDQALRDMDDLDPAFDIEQAQEGTVLAAVRYWIETYNVNENGNIITITNELRLNLVKKFAEELDK